MLPGPGTSSEAPLRRVEDLSHDPPPFWESLSEETASDTVAPHAKLHPQPVLRASTDHLRTLLERVARSGSNLLVQGETGVGKEVVAEAVHLASDRGDRPLLRINCASLPDSLLESELFGYEKGAFTGATARKIGLLEAAHNGTVLLDEAGDMPMAVQAALLRAIETRQILRIGSRVATEVDVRYIATTHRDVEQLICTGGFREDLYYRLNGIAIVVPPLRHRADDIEPLATFFVEAEASTLGFDVPPRLTRQALRWLLEHDWPGNVRELRSCIRRALVLCNGPTIEIDHVASKQLTAMPGVLSQPVELALDRRPRPRRCGHLRGAQQLEINQIEAALTRCDGNQAAAARCLGISRSTLIRRLRRLNGSALEGESDSAPSLVASVSMSS